ESLLLFADKFQKTGYEKVLLTKLGEGITAKENLLEMKATLLMREDKLAEAEAILSKLTTKPVEVEGVANESRIKDCIACYEESKLRFTKLQLIQQIAQLKQQANQADKNKAALANYQLGNIYYNTTYFGFAWKALDYFRPYSYTAKDAEYFDGSRALAFYKQAITLAKQAGNKELAAQSYFMAAKCEQNTYYLKMRNDSWDYLEPSYAPENRRYFTQLKQEFSGTAFYKQALGECFYLNSFAKR
ncbi:MAG: hypothetical protein H7Y04_05320, partial [Verrucomicrobia bacterium]|nr:hypothetical protein [Cytophagales bacterium]